MNTTNEFLDAVKAKHGLSSDYALAHKLGITRQAISKYRNSHGQLEDSLAISVAKLLEIDAAYVVACMHSERAKREDEKAVWREIIERFGGVAASVLITFAACAMPSPDAFAAAQSAHSVYYVK